MIRVQAAYALAGVVFAAIAVFSAFDRANRKRWNNTAFWGLFALSFLAGDALGDFGNGVLVIAMVGIGAVGGVGVTKPATTTIPEREASAALWGNRLFLPILIVPLAALVGTLALPAIEVAGAPLVDPGQVTVISMAFGAILALAVALAMLRPAAAAAPQEARRLMDSVGWAAILPQLLAALGA
ncbi:MAG: DUF979 domain-containing protein, partial [Pseudomonadota bacterium]|nr:DUF979 domain-containing protein [Pseudomonadota bacterium]